MLFLSSEKLKETCNGEKEEPNPTQVEVCVLKAGEGTLHTLRGQDILEGDGGMSTVPSVQGTQSRTWPSWTKSGNLEQGDVAAGQGLCTLN